VYNILSSKSFISCFNNPSANVVNGDKELQRKKIFLIKHIDCTALAHAQQYVRDLL